MQKNENDQQKEEQELEAVVTSKGTKVTSPNGNKRQEQTRNQNVQKETQKYERRTGMKLKHKRRTEAERT